MGEYEDARSLTGTGTVCRVGVCAVEVTVAGADAGGWRGGAAVGRAGQAGPLSLLCLVAPRGTGWRGEKDGRLTSIPADTNPPHLCGNLALPKHRSRSPTSQTAGAVLVLPKSSCSYKRPFCPVETPRQRTPPRPCPDPDPQLWGLTDEDVSSITRTAWTCRGRDEREEEEEGGGREETISGLAAASTLLGRPHPSLKLEDNYS